MLKFFASVTTLLQASRPVWTPSTLQLTSINKNRTLRTSQLLRISDSRDLSPYSPVLYEIQAGFLGRPDQVDAMICSICNADLN